MNVDQLLNSPFSKILQSWKGQNSSGKFKMLLTFFFPKTYGMEMKFLVSNSLDSFVERKKIALLKTVCENLILEKKNPCGFIVVVKPAQEMNNL